MEEGENKRSTLQTGSSREEILDGFIGSDEYGKLCISYGIDR